MMTRPDSFDPEKIRSLRSLREQQIERERKKSRTHRRNQLVVGSVAVLLLATGILHFGWHSAYGAFVVRPEFNKQVHGHVVNAYYANTPDLMIEELQKARAGMERFGLSIQYSTLIPWKKTPDNNMVYQYKIVDSVIERAVAVRMDRDRQVHQGTSDQLGDVYEQKMDNLRGFIKEEGWLDDISFGAFQIEQHPYWAWWANWGWWVFFPVAGVVLVSLGILSTSFRSVFKTMVSP